MSPSSLKQCTVFLLCGLLAAESAYALKSDKSQPINIQADHGDFRSDPKNNSNGTGIYTGHVVITQGSIMLTADKAILHVANNELDTADVTGNPATFQQQPDNGQMVHGMALEITYDASKSQMDLITNARMTQAVDQVNGDILSAPPAGTVRAPITVTSTLAPYVAQGERLMTADRIRYNTETQRMVATGGGKDDGRVHITFPPKLLPVEMPETADQRRLDFENAQAAVAASRVAAAKAARMTAVRAATSRAMPAESTHTSAPAAATHPGAPP
ncbi:MAG TPA: lipopolysaccharide transport periplasmic protein LptA [Gammaproteobacteria bacterium]|jgi:lipopolysaccharide export system protein LptA|nr:lipopolysaccharide transport periplasmic protein LptA [Gammaproteobacteria bacterium]